MKKYGLILAITLSQLIISEVSQAREFTCEDAYTISVTGAVNHLSRPAVDADLVAKSIYPYLERKDSDNLYLTKSEYENLIKDFESKKVEAYEKLKAYDCSAYEEVDKKVDAAKERFKKLVKEVLAEKSYGEPVDLKRMENGEPRHLVSEAEQKVYIRYLITKFIEVEKNKEPSLAKIKEKFGKNFFNQRKKSMSKKEERAILVTKSLFLSFDPHSGYSSEDEADEMRSSVSANFEGLGVNLQDNDLGGKIVNVMPNSPAARSKKIEAGDIIVKVNNQSMANFELSEIVKLTRGPKGTKVLLTLSREDKKTKKVKIFDVEIVRDSISMEDQKVKSKVVKIEGKNILVLNLPVFYGDHARSNSTYDLINAYNEQKKESSIDGVILDLRNNPGGLLDESVRIVGLFIDKPVSVQVKDARGVKHYNAKTSPVFIKEPMVVLINKASASAAEIVAGALKDYGRAVIVGDERTYGKGTVQSVLDTLRQQGLGLFKVTIAKFYTPGGSSTQIKGVAADIVVPSPTQLLDLGEKNQKYVLDWSEVASVFKGSINTAVTKVLPDLKKKSEARVKANKDFERFKDLATYEQWKKDSDSKKEKEVVTSPLYAEKNRFDVEKDPVLKEGLLVNVDLINETKDSTLPVAAATDSP